MVLLKFCADFCLSVFAFATEWGIWNNNSNSNNNNNIVIKENKLYSYTPPPILSLYITKACIT